jgi:hypothetical protein
MTTRNWGKEKIRLSNVKEELRPVELHMKENGSIGEFGDEPSFAMVMVGTKGAFFGQFSLATIKDCFNQLGYDLVKK